MNDAADLADHHFRVLWLALIIAAREGAVVNTEKMMKMALAHDIAESRTGDVDYLARQYVDRHEDKALTDMFEDTSLQAEFLELAREYEARESLESQIVKDADNLDVDLELKEREGQGHPLPAQWQANGMLVGRTKFYTKAAQAMQYAIQGSNSHDWHVKSSSNRVNGGDWKPKATATKLAP